MNPRALQTETIRHDADKYPAPSLRSVVKKSALLNLSIVLTSFPVLAYAGGPKAFAPTVEIMVGISFLVWIATFALYFFVSLPWLFRTPASSASRREATGGDC